jgi:trehalose-phosphatase
MKYLFRYSGEVISKIQKSRKVFLFLDYDGTLTPIASRPEKAKISARVRTLIKGLNSHRWIRIAIVSGRSLKDIKKMVGVKGIIYAGNHGLEIQNEKGKIKKTVPVVSSPLLKSVTLSLKRSLKGIAGVIIEDKGLTISVHFRMVSPRIRGTVKKIFRKTISRYLSSKNIRVTYGKMVLEIRPAVKWDKGNAVFALLGKTRALSVYIGDDITDNDAFLALKGKGICIFVGSPGKSIASGYYLKNPAEVEVFLSMLTAI